MNDKRAVLFYLGQFLSAMGSLTFNLCLLAFMPRAGFSLAQISLILGLQRFLPVFVMGVWGHLTDSFSPKLTVAALEIAAQCVAIRGTRQDMKLLDNCGIDGAPAHAILANARFAVFRRSIH